MSMKSDVSEGQIKEQSICQRCRLYAVDSFRFNVSLVYMMANATAAVVAVRICPKRRRASPPHRKTAANVLQMLAILACEQQCPTIERVDPFGSPSCHAVVNPPIYCSCALDSQIQLSTPHLHAKKRSTPRNWLSCDCRE